MTNKMTEDQGKSLELKYEMDRHTTNLAQAKLQTGAGSTTT